MRLSELPQEAHGAAVAAGWYDGIWGPTPEGVAVRLALIHAEVSEALEEVRRPGPELVTPALGEELADVVLRVADLAGWLEIDLAAAVQSKMEINRTRTRRHGDKRL